MKELPQSSLTDNVSYVKQRDVEFIAPIYNYTFTSFGFTPNNTQETASSGQITEFQAYYATSKGKNFNNATLISAPNNIILNTITGQGDPFTSLKSGMIFEFTATYNNTGSVNINIDSIGAINVLFNNATLLSDYIIAGYRYYLQFNGTNLILLNKYNTKLSELTNDMGFLKSISTYSVISAKTDANGYASFINKVSNTEISFDVSVPIVLCYADGFIESNATLTNITGISADGTYFIIKEKGSNSYATTLQPVESIVAPSTPATNQLWLDTSIMPYVPKKWNGSQWVATQFVKLGELTRTSGVIGSPVSYALNRRYKSDEFAVVINTTYTKQDNLGTLDANVELYARCISAEHGYAVNSIVKPIPLINATANRAIPSVKYDRNSSSFCTYNIGDTGMMTSSLTTKADVSLTSARWRFFFVVQANF